METPPNKLSPSERKRIFEFLRDHPVGVLATTNPDGSPHASAIYISTDEELRITFTTKRETHKYQNISKDSRVMLAVYDGKNQAVVQASGRAIEAKEPEAQHEIYQGTLQAAKRTGEDIVPPVAKIVAGPFVGFTIELDNIWLSEYGWGDTFAHSLKHIQDPRLSGDPA